MLPKDIGYYERELRRLRKENAELGAAAKELMAEIIKLTEIVLNLKSQIEKEN